MRHGSVPEVIEHGRTGFIVETVDEMVEAARHIDEIDPAECRRAVEERFGIDHFVAAARGRLPAAARRAAVLRRPGRREDAPMKLPYDDVHLIADPLYGYLRITAVAGRRDRRGRRHRQPVGAAAQAHPPAAELVVGVPHRRAQPLRPQPRRHAPRRAAGAAGVPHAGRGRAGHAVAAAGRRDPAAGRAAARRRPRPVQPLLRRGVLRSPCSGSTTSRSRSTSSSTSSAGSSRSCAAARRGRSRPTRRSTPGTWPSWCGRRRGRAA